MVEDEKQNIDLDARLEEIKRQSMEELENMQRVISENEKIKADIAYKAEQGAKETSEIKKNGKLATVIFIAALIAICSISLISINIFKPYRAYNNAMKLLEQKQYDAAIKTFEELEDFEDSKTMIKECKYSKSESLLEQGKNGLAISGFSEIRDYKDSKSKIDAFIGSGDGVIAVGDRHSVAVNSIGRVLATGDNSFGQCNVSEWNGISAVAAGSNHTIALCADGSVVATGKDDYGQCDVDDWHNIVYICASGNTSYGIRADGSMVAAGDNALGQCNVENSNFTNVIKAAATGQYVAALKNDGSVILTSADAKFEPVKAWKNVRDISAFSQTLCAVTTDGSVLTCGDVTNNTTGEWADVKFVAAGYLYAVAIKDNGEVISTMELADSVAAAFENALRIECGAGHILALQDDGTVMPIGQNKYGECDVSKWCDIMVK